MYYEYTLLGGQGEMDEDAPRPPEELILLWEIETYKAMPWPGGLFDQPFVTMSLVNLCANIRLEVEKVKESQERVKDELRRGATY